MMRNPEDEFSDSDPNEDISWEDLGMSQEQGDYFKVTPSEYIRSYPLAKIEEMTKDADSSKCMFELGELYYCLPHKSLEPLYEILHQRHSGLTRDYKPIFKTKNEFVNVPNTKEFNDDAKLVLERVIALLYSSLSKKRSACLEHKRCIEARHSAQIKFIICLIVLVVYLLN
jgi:hypothetical protein